jgi:hypothetical protein
MMLMSERPGGTNNNMKAQQKVDCEDPAGWVSEVLQRGEEGLNLEAQSNLSFYAILLLMDDEEEPQQQSNTTTTTITMKMTTTHPWLVPWLSSSRRIGNRSRRAAANGVGKLSVAVISRGRDDP